MSHKLNDWMTVSCNYYMFKKFTYLAIVLVWKNNVHIKDLCTNKKMILCKMF